MVARLPLFRQLLETQHIRKAAWQRVDRSMNGRSGVPPDVTTRKRRPSRRKSSGLVSTGDPGVIRLYEEENLSKLEMQGCLKSIGISLLVDWDILIFLLHHGAILSNADQMARLLCCKPARIGDALDRLESRGLIESSRPSKRLRLYKVVVSSDSARQDCFQQLLRLAGDRGGRLLLAKVLKPGDPETVLGVRSVPLT
jgi:DNA-binding MarR family transcriptional regulator